MICDFPVFVHKQRTHVGKPIVSGVVCLRGKMQKRWKVLFFPPIVYETQDQHFLSTLVI